MSDSELERLWNKVNTIDRKLDDIIKTLKDDQYGRPGIITKIEENREEIKYIKENEVTELRRKMDRVYWTAGIFIFIAATITATVTISL